MPTNALTNPLVLPILGVLTEGPRHGYALFTALRDRYTNLTVRRSSVYTLLDRLVEEGWAELRDTPAPAPYAITDAGSRSLADIVTRQLADAPLGPSEPFMVAIAYLGVLAPDQAVALLTRRLDMTLEQLERSENVIASHPIRELHMLEVHYLRSALRHDATWLEEATRRIAIGELAWPQQSEAGA